MHHRRLFLSLVLVLAVLAVGVGTLRYFSSQRQPPARRTATHAGPLVATTVAQRQGRTVTLSATGTLQAATRAALAPQVSGVVMTVADDLRPGVRFPAGGLLFAIDDRDYRLAREQARASVARAEADLAVLQAKAATARKEWLRRNPDTPAPPLVVYQPQLAEAEAQLAAARAGLARTELDLARTRITAPFDCMVVEEKVETGAYVKSGEPLVTVSGTGSLEVVVPLAPADLAWIRVGGDDASPATVVGPNGGQWQGRVARRLPAVEETSRLARVVVVLEQPYEKDNQPLLGMFVTVTIAGRHLPAVVSIPRSALREGAKVWTVDGDNRLHIVPVTVLRYAGDEVWLAGGLAGGETVVLTPLSGVADNMAVRPQPVDGDRP